MKKFLAGLLTGLLVAALLATAVPALAGVNGQFRGYEIIKVLVNGKEVQSDVPAIMMGNRTMVPLRFVSEAMGANVVWDDTARQVEIEARILPTANKASIQSTIQDLAKRYRDRAAKINSNTSPSSEEVNKFITESSRDATRTISALASIAISPGEDWSKEGVQLALLNQAIASEWGFWNMYQTALRTGSFQAPKMQAAPMAFWKGLIEAQIK